MVEELERRYMTNAIIYTAPNIVEVTEDEGPIELEPASNNVSSITARKFLGLFCFQFVFKQKLLVI
jgi:hypothetical protein